MLSARVPASRKDRMLMQAEKETTRAPICCVPCLMTCAISNDYHLAGSSATYLEQENENVTRGKGKPIHNIEEDAQWLLNMVENLLSVTRIQMTRA